MTPEEIVKIDASKNNKEFPESVVMKAFQHLQESPNIRMLQYGNTILVLEQLSLEQFEFHFINAEKYGKFCINVKRLLLMAKEQGVKMMMTDFKNPRIIDVASTTGADYSIQETPDGYTMTVRL